MGHEPLGQWMPQTTAASHINKGNLMLKVCHYFIIGALLTGCSSTAPSFSSTDSSTVTPITKADCCRDYSEFYYVPLAANDELNLTVNNENPVWHFPQGESYFNAFSFAPSAGKVKVTISSVMANERVFAPAVTLLDRHFQPQQHYSLTSFKVKYADMLGHNRYEKTFEVNAEKTPYLVVYTDSQDLGKTITIPHPAKLRAMKSGEPLPIVADLQYHHANSGKIRVAVTTLSVRQHPAHKVTQQQAPAPKKAESVTPAQPAAPVSVQQQTVNYYYQAIRQAVAQDQLDQALALLAEAKTLHISGAQKVFIDAVHAHQ